jgi:FkbM family methyltransferase
MGMRTSALREMLVDRVPALGRWKRAASAVWHAAAPARESYSQHGEDSFLYERLRRYRLESGIYVDVGANHPMAISNTYLFYRHGFQGIVIEPIAELVALHRRFRPRDVALCAGAGSRPGVAELRIAKAPVGSSFGDLDEGLVWRRELVPVVTLDQVLDAHPAEWVYLLSIDVEGKDVDVLHGAGAMLERVLFVCVESNEEHRDAVITEQLVARGFAMVTKLGCNLIFENDNARFAAYST